MIIEEILTGVFKDGLTSEEAAKEIAAKEATKIAVLPLGTILETLKAREIPIADLTKEKFAMGLAEKKVWISKENDSEQFTDFKKFRDDIFNSHFVNNLTYRPETAVNESDDPVARGYSDQAQYNCIIKLENGKYYFNLGWGSAIVLRRVRDGSGYVPFRLYTNKFFYSHSIFKQGTRAKPLANLEKDDDEALFVDEGSWFVVADWCSEHGLAKQLTKSYKKYQFKRPLQIDKVITRGVSSCSCSVLFPNTKADSNNNNKLPNYLIFCHTDNNASPIPSILMDLLLKKDGEIEDKLVAMDVGADQFRVIVSVFPELGETIKHTSYNLLPKELRNSKIQILLMPRESHIWRGIERIPMPNGYDEYGLHFLEGQVNILANYGQKVGFSERYLARFFNGTDLLLEMEDLLDQLGNAALDQEKKKLILKEIRLYFNTKLCAGEFGKKHLMDTLFNQLTPSFTGHAGNYPEATFFKLASDVVTFSDHKKTGKFAQKYGRYFSDQDQLRRFYSFSINDFPLLFQKSQKMDTYKIIDHSPSLNTKENLKADFSKLFEGRRKVMGWWG